MCSAVKLGAEWGPTLLMAVCLMAAPLSAQEADTRPTDVQTDVDLQSLVDRFQALEAEVEAEDQARRIARGMRMDLATVEFQVGLLNVVARSDQRVEVEAALREAVEFYAQAVAGGSEHVLSDGVWIAQFFEGDLAADLGVWREGAELVEISSSEGEERMIARTEELLGRRLQSRLPERARNWMGGSPLTEPGFNAGYTWELLQREAVSSGSVAVRECLGGAPASCWSVLGFPRTDHTLSEWYTPEERRLIALLQGQLSLRMGRAFRRGDGSVDDNRLEVARRTLAACRRHDIEACDQFTSYTLGHRSPLAMIFRTSLVWHALETGGTGAYARFVEALEAGQSIPDAVGTAARQPSDVVVQSWAARVARATVEVQADLGGASLATLMWLLCFAGIGVFGANRRTVR